MFNASDEDIIVEVIEFYDFFFVYFNTCGNRDICGNGVSNVQREADVGNSYGLCKQHDA